MRAKSAYPGIPPDNLPAEANLVSLTRPYPASQSHAVAIAFLGFALLLLDALGSFVLLAQLRFEKGARRGHRLGDVVVLAFDERIVCSQLGRRGR